MPLKKEVEQGFKIENLSKYKIGGGLAKMYEQTHGLLEELSVKLNTLINNPRLQTILPGKKPLQLKGFGYEMPPITPPAGTAQAVVSKADIPVTPLRRGVASIEPYDFQSKLQGLSLREQAHVRSAIFAEVPSKAENMYYHYSSDPRNPGLVAEKLDDAIRAQQIETILIREKAAIAKAREIASKGWTSINVVRLLNETANDLRARALKNVGSNKRIQAAINTLREDIVESLGGSVANVAEAQDIKRAVGKLGAWQYGMRDPDASAMGEGCESLLYEIALSDRKSSNGRSKGTQ